MNIGSFIFFPKTCPSPLILPISVNSNSILFIVQNIAVGLGWILFLIYLTAQSPANSVGSTVDIDHKLDPSHHIHCHNPDPSHHDICFGLLQWPDFLLLISSAVYVLPGFQINLFHFLFILFYFILFLLFRTTHTAYGGSQARGQIRATAASLCHSHSNSGSKPRLGPGSTTHSNASSPPPTERGQGSNPRPSWILVRFISAGPQWELQINPNLYHVLFFFFFLTVSNASHLSVKAKVLTTAGLLFSLWFPQSQHPSLLFLQHGTHVPTVDISLCCHSARTALRGEPIDLFSLPSGLGSDIILSMRTFLNIRRKRASPAPLPPLLSSLRWFIGPPTVWHTIYI